MTSWSDRNLQRGANVQPSITKLRTQSCGDSLHDTNLKKLDSGKASDLHRDVPGSDACRKTNHPDCFANFLSRSKHIVLQISPRLRSSSSFTSHYPLTPPAHSLIDSDLKPPIRKGTSLNGVYKLNPLASGILSVSSLSSCYVTTTCFFCTLYYSLYKRRYLMLISLVGNRLTHKTQPTFRRS